jgi:glycosyltransferase involved in cell wall biosynthesis
LRRDYGLGSGRVLVFPAITHPHKGHLFLLEVMGRYWDDPDLRLVLLGGAGAADDEVTATIERLGLGHRVVRPGRVTDAHRDGLIALADALVFPSEYEGFGAPVVEAMALGTPVICSDEPALAEVVGDAGIVLPRDGEAWADALDVLTRRSAELRSAGRLRAASFTAERSGAGLAMAYRTALDVAR